MSALRCRKQLAYTAQTAVFGRRAVLYGPLGGVFICLSDFGWFRKTVFSICTAQKEIIVFWAVIVPVPLRQVKADCRSVVS